ncbi:thiamine-phosphate kinase [Halomonas denitrificans]|nr:thiamine-phosphate kinase [Halomonas denitrificans]
MNEFDLIERIRRRAARSSGHDDDGIVLGIGDDAAVLQPGRGMQLVATVDQLVDGRHFDGRATAADVGHLAAAANLSDLAAMGAAPRWLLLALTLPEADADWLDGFLDGFLGLAGRFGAELAGGNLTRGPLNVSVTAIGEIPAGQFARRTGARPGDRILVTGWPGDAAAALALDCPRSHPLCDRLFNPTPRVEHGRKLAGVARGMIDVSDGLAADLGHLLGDALGAEIEVDRLPASGALLEAVPEPARRVALQLGGGGDYELIAVVPEHAGIPEAIDGVPVTAIGTVTRDSGLRCIDADGRDVTPSLRGWDHFSDDPEPGSSGRGSR